MPHLRPPAPLFLAAAVVLTACGGGSGADGGAAVVTDHGALAVVGRDDLTWAPPTLTAEAGTLTVALTCEPAVNHNLVIDETDELVAECAPGATATGTVTLEPGTYAYVCTIPGHETTMRGSLTVE
jgi:plastocyanin